MIIVWKILAYKNIEQIIYLIEYIINNSLGVVFLHYDKKSSSKEFYMIQEHFLNNYRVFCYQKFCTDWGSYNIIEAEYFLSQEIVKAGISYDYSINITGDTFFTKSLKALENFLLVNYGKSFVVGAPVKPLYINEENYLDIYKKELDHMFCSTVYHQFYPRGINKLRYFNPDLTWAEISRILIHFPISNTLCKDRIKSKLVIFGYKLFSWFFGIMPLPFGYLHRSGIYNCPFNIFRASMHMILFHEVAQKIINNKDVEIFKKSLKKCFAPDEIFFPSVVYHFTDKKNLELDTNFGLMGYSSSISEDDFPQLLSEQSRFFARKFTSISVMEKIQQYFH